jgi:hypothetical protein
MTEGERRQLFDATTQWYFDEAGGIFLSPRARPLYLTAKENLLCPDSEVRPHGALAELDEQKGADWARGRLAIRQFTLLRWVMRFDLSVHTEPYDEELTPKDIEFLRECGHLDIDKRPFKGKWRKQPT